MGEGYIAAKASEIDLIWIRSNRRSYRIRYATEAEIEAFPKKWPDYPYLKTVIRASDAATATFAFNGDDPDMWKLSDLEIAGMFDVELDELGDLP